MEKNLFRQNGGPLQIGSPDFISQTNASKIGCVGEREGKTGFAKGLKKQDLVISGTNKIHHLLGES